MEIHHVGYLVKKIEKTMQAFENLGFELTSTLIRDQDRKANICFIKKDGYCIELIEPWKDSELYPLLKKYKNTAYHICYAVNDIEEAIKQLEVSGYVLFKSVQRACAIGENAKVAFMMNANLGMIELVEISI